MTTRWRCEICEGPVSAQDGLVAWPDLSACSISRPFEFFIVHRGVCAKHASRHIHRCGINDLLGADGLARLTAMLSEGIATNRAVLANPRTPDTAPPTDAWVDLFRRLHLPGYEQVRKGYLMDVRVHYTGRAEDSVAPYVQAQMAAYSQWSERTLAEVDARIPERPDIPPFDDQPDRNPASLAPAPQAGQFDVQGALAAAVGAVRESKG